MTPYETYTKTSMLNGGALAEHDAQLPQSIKRANKRTEWQTKLDMPAHVYT